MGYTASTENNGARLDGDINVALRMLYAFILADNVDAVVSTTPEDKFQAFRRLLSRYAKGEPTRRFILHTFFDPDADTATSLEKAASAESLEMGVIGHTAFALSGGMLFLTSEGGLGLGFCDL